MDIAAKQTALQKRRTELANHLIDTEHSLDVEPPKDWEDRSSERQGDEVLESLGQVEMAELRRIDAALIRISDGTYGLCQDCGDTISDARLDLLPDTPFCKICAR